MSETGYRAVFAKNFKYLLSEHGESQADIARLLSVSKSTVSSWAMGVKMPRMDKIEELALHFGVIKSDLIEEKFGEKDNEGELKIALFGGDGEVTDEMWEEAKNYALYIKERERKRREGK